MTRPIESAPPVKQTDYEAIVVGGGAVGLAAALALARAGIATALAAPPRAGPGQIDRRTSALFTGSIELLRNLGVWDAVLPASEAITGIRIIDDTGALLRAPEVTFTATGAKLDVFGFNVPNDALTSALDAATQTSCANLHRLATRGVEQIEILTDSARLGLAEGATLRTPLVVAADGRKSICRAAAGIGTRDWPYEQAALVTCFAHQRPHHGISTELHRPAGPLTTVPMPGRASSLVWVERPTEAARLAKLDDTAFRQELEIRLQGLLGTVGAISPRATFPLSVLRADRLAQNRVALVGEAGHVIPPIGAQGLNLGMRDVAALADCLFAARAAGHDPGGEEILARYHTARRLDVSSRTWGIDLLNRSLISGLVPVHLLRGAGLHALRSIAPLRHLVVSEGLHPSSVSSSLMKPRKNSPGA